MAIWSLRRTRSPGSPSDAAALVTSCMEVPIGKRSQKARACISARYSTTSIPAMAAIGIATSAATHLDRRRMFKFTASARAAQRRRRAGRFSPARARQPRVLHLLDELAEVARAERSADGRAHGLLDQHEAPVDHAHLRIAPRELGERLLHAGGGLEPVLHEQLDRRGWAGRAYELRALQRARQVQVVGALAAHGNAHAFAIDVGDGAQRRIRGDEVGPLDHDIWGVKAISV